MMMSDEETKKRWRVRTWEHGQDRSDGSYGKVEHEAENLERMLNQLDADHYEIYEVDFGKRMIVGCLEDPHELIADASMPEPLGSLANALLIRLSALREVPEVTPPTSPAPPQASEPEDEAAKALLGYQIQGQRTMHLLSGIQSVTTCAQLGDPQADQRLAAIIHNIFASAPIEETRKSLADLEFFKDHHLKYSCEDVACQAHQVFESAVTKLKARIAAQPAN
jgi:hypothetical protein